MTTFKGIFVVTYMLILIDNFSAVAADQPDADTLKFLNNLLSYDPDPEINPIESSQESTFNHSSSSYN
jgi:hypothetical protein